MTGRSDVHAVDKDTNLFSLHRRSIKRRSHGRSTCCGSEKKFRNVQIRYARCTRFGCKYRGPIGVSSSRTPSLSFSIHIDLAHLEKDANSAFAFEACTRNGAMGSKLSWGELDQIEKKRCNISFSLVDQRSKRVIAWLQQPSLDSERRDSTMSGLLQRRLLCFGFFQDGMSGMLCRIDDNPKLAASDSSSKIGSILTTELIHAFARRAHMACQHLIQPCEREYLLHARSEIDEVQLASSLLGRDVHTDDHAQP